MYEPYLSVLWSDPSDKIILGWYPVISWHISDDPCTSRQILVIPVRKLANVIFFKFLPIPVRNKWFMFMWSFHSHWIPQQIWVEHLIKFIIRLTPVHCNSCSFPILPIPDPVHSRSFASKLPRATLRPHLSPEFQCFTLCLISPPCLPQAYLFHGMKSHWPEECMCSPWLPMPWISHFYWRSHLSQGMMLCISSQIYPLTRNCQNVNGNPQTPFSCTHSWKSHFQQPPPNPNDEPAFKGGAIATHCSGFSTVCTNIFLT